MDLETVQLLNLSPIPELSELELSTMLDQLSGLSDLNEDLTDRNVQDILKEAENLIDTSVSSKINDLPITDTVSEPEKHIKYPSEDFQKINETQESFSDTKSDSSPVENLSPKSSSTKTHESSKHHNSPVEESNKIFSPGGSSNPIKSTIDSLKEFSTLVEKKLKSRSTISVQKQNHCDDKQISKSVEANINSNPILKSAKEKIDSNVKNNFDPVKTNKPSQLLNCFERLYQERPKRLSYKKCKVTDKTPKTMIKKKHVKDLKSQISKPGKIVRNKNSIIELRNKMNGRDSESSLTKHYLEGQYSLKGSSSKCHSANSSVECNYVSVVPPKRIEEASVHCKHNSPIKDFTINDSTKILSQIDDKLILKLLQGIEEIKDHVKKAGVIKNEVPRQILEESQAVIESLKYEMESVRKKVASEKNAGIQRLEEQFVLLKEKYDQHMMKLEAENLKLREALSEKFNIKATTRTESASNIEVQSSCNAERKIFRSFSLENCLAPKNSPCSSLEDMRSSVRKEAFSQTEIEVRSMSVQCLEAQYEEVTLEEDAKKTENKENVTAKKKLGKEKPFSEKNTHQLMKQKRIAFDHDSQLLATLRGLQAEITLKEKENRKLKTEIDLLKNQEKKTGKKVAGYKKRHIGTQTIGLGVFVQKPYDPEFYEVPGGFQKENEELKSKIKALEEDFELLKEKRVNDLQTLHQVHEEEMAKLLSKLETQSALTKHLHSLLLNR